jgi:hypothetical protein
MTTYTEHQMKARITDLEYALSQIVNHIERFAPEILIEQEGYAYTAGALQSRLKEVRAMAQRGLDLMA